MGLLDAFSDATDKRTGTANPMIGPDRLNSGLGALSGVLGLIPGFGTAATIANGVLGAATGVDGAREGSAADRFMNAVGTESGILGTIASVAGVAPELGTSLGAIGTGGAAGSAAAGGAVAGGATAASVLGAGAAGWAYGNLLNDEVKDLDILGHDSSGHARSISDRAGDDGWAAHEAVAHLIGGEDGSFRAGAGNVLGHVAGIGTTLGESVLGGAAGIAAAPLVLGDAIGRGIGGLLH